MASNKPTDQSFTTTTSIPKTTSTKSVIGLAKLREKVFEQNIFGNKDIGFEKFGNLTNMAARRPPRNGKEDRDDAHEERSMWDQIVRDLEKCKAISNRAKEVSRLIIEKEEKMAKRMQYFPFYQVPSLHSLQYSCLFFPL